MLLILLLLLLLLLLLSGNIFVHDGSPRNEEGKFNGNEYCLPTA
jgi:hypothetical protein